MTATGPSARVTLRPTARAIILFSLSLPAALCIVIAFPSVWYTALYMPCLAVALMAADLTMLLPGRSVDVALSAPPMAYVGRSCAVNIKAAASQKRRVALQALLEYIGEAEGPHIMNSAVENGQMDLRFAFTPARRGQIRLQALWMRWRGPLGLLEAIRREALDTIIDIVPDVYGIHERALQLCARDALYGSKSQRLKGEGAEFETLREYSQGMDTRFIDWRGSARHRKLLAKEFRQERNHQIVFGFDTGHLMLEPVNGIPKLDHAIHAGLLLGWISLHSGDLVGGCGFDARLRGYVKPGRGMPWFTPFQRFTAGLDYHTEETNFTLGLLELNSRLLRRSLVILFTEFVDMISAELLLESLQIMTRRHLVVFITMRDPMLTALQDAPPRDFVSVAEAVVADGFLRERAVVLERIARLGVHCLDLPAREISSALLNRYLLIKQRGLL